MTLNKLKTRFQVPAFLAAALFVIVGCGGGGGSETATPSSDTGTVSEVAVKVSLPENIDVGTLKAFTSLGGTDVSTEGEVTVKGPGTNPFLVIVKSGDTPVAMSLVLPDRDDNELSCLDTTVALLLFRTGLTAAPDRFMGDLVDEIKGIPAVNDMARAICTALESDIKAVVEPDRALGSFLFAAEEAVRDHLLLLSGTSPS